MTEHSAYDCRKCGICCTSLTWEDTYVNLTPTDEKRLGKHYVRLNVINGEIRTRPTVNKAGPLKGAEDCRCVSLRGSLGKQVSCAIYEKRPDICKKALKPGDRTCRQIRRLFNDMLERDVIGPAVT